jgi:hypothetical protein
MWSTFPAKRNHFLLHLEVVWQQHLFPGTKFPVVKSCFYFFHFLRNRILLWRRLCHDDIHLSLKLIFGLFVLCIRNYRPSNIDAEFCYWYQESLRDTIVVVLWNHSILTTLASDVWTWMFVDVTQITRRFYKRKTCDRRKPVGSLERLVYFYAIMSVGGRRMENYSLVGERKKELFTRKLLTFFWNFLTVAKKIERVGNLAARWRWRIVFVRKRRGRRWKGGKMYHSGLKMLFFFLFFIWCLPWIVGGVLVGSSCKTFPPFKKSKKKKNSLWFSWLLSASSTALTAS